MSTRPLIALLTDFGLEDAYVGVMKGVVLSICPAAQLVDFSHAVAPQDVRGAAYLLFTAARYFPPETIFLVVVDPGVGTARAPIAVEAEHGRYVAPDNGVLSYALTQVGLRRAVRLENPAYALPDISRTFHGRDIFSPAAAHLACGAPLDRLGPPLLDLVRLPAPRLEVQASAIRGEALHVDHFGNVITSIGQLVWQDDRTLRLTPQFGASAARDLAAPACRMTVGERTLSGIRATYGAAAPGEALLLVGSSGQLEIGVNQGSAARVFGLRPGDALTLEVGG